MYLNFGISIEKQGSMSCFQRLSLLKATVNSFNLFLINHKEIRDGNSGLFIVIISDLSFELSSTLTHPNSLIFLYFHSFADKQV